MFKELNRLWVRGQHEAAAWRRWHRKLPQNRVRRERLRDAAGRVIGYGPPTPVPEPSLSSPFCRLVELPSSKVDLFVDDRGIEGAYCQARRPCATADDVKPLPVGEDEVRRLFEEFCR
jgi:hypothetical protein